MLGVEARAIRALRRRVGKSAMPFGIALLLYSLLPTGFPLLSSCQSDSIDIPPAQALAFSVDTLTFDSVFIGSISSTRRLTLYNRSSRPIAIDRVHLGGGEASPFSLLIDGRLPGDVESLRIPPRDSLLILARVQPKLKLNDTITQVFDSLSFQLADASRHVFLRAAGLAALNLDIDTLRTDWHIAGPPAHLISRTIFVPKGITLSLENGAALYFSPNAGLRVAGKLSIKGNAQHPVVLAGHRLETYYRRKPGQWLGIALLPQSGSHEVVHAIIRGAITAIRADSLGAGHELHITDSRIFYSSLEGVDLSDTHLELQGSILAQNYRSALRINGASATLRHSTLWTSSVPPQVRTGPLVLLQAASETTVNKLSIINTILWGDRDAELMLSPAKQSQLNLLGRNSLCRVVPSDTLNSAVWQRIIIRDPILNNPLDEDFSLSARSPARGNADPKQTLLVPYDLLGNVRLQSNGSADIGALVYIQK